MSTRLAIAGLGVAGAAMLTAALADEDVELVAVADERIEEFPSALASCCSRYGRVDDLVRDNAVEVVHVATPTPLHSEHVRLAIAAGRHVVVEKPVTESAAAAATLRAEVEDARRIALVGHSESFEPYVAATREVLASGAIGEVLSVVASKHTDWMRRPRRREELDPDLGGGIVRRQGVHQVDVVRTLLQSRLEVVRSRPLPDRARATLGGYLAWLEAGDGRSVVLVQDGRGLTHATSSGHDKRGRAGLDEASTKHENNRRRLEQVLAARQAPSLGGSDVEQIVVIGTDGRIEASSKGVTATTSSRTTTIELGQYREGRGAVLDELLRALRGERTLHDLAWGEENLRICEALEDALAAAR